MSAQLSCAASLDVAHGLVLFRAKTVDLPVDFTMCAENRRDLKRWPSHEVRPLY